MIAPTFNQKILNEYPRIIGEQCNILIDMLSAQSGKGEIDHCRYLTNCALDIVGGKYTPKVKSKSGVPSRCRNNIWGVDQRPSFQWELQSHF
jgi:hypothetical protein